MELPEECNQTNDEMRTIDEDVLSSTSQVVNERVIVQLLNSTLSQECSSKREELKILHKLVNLVLWIYLTDTL
jgi:hypothetical protein